MAKNFTNLIGTSTTEELKELLALCIENLPEQDLMEVLEAEISEDLKAELAASWDN